MQAHTILPSKEGLRRPVDRSSQINPVVGVRSYSRFMFSKSRITTIEGSGEIGRKNKTVLAHFPQQPQDERNEKLQACRLKWVTWTQKISYWFETILVDQGAVFRWVTAFLVPLVLLMAAVVHLWNTSPLLDDTTGEIKSGHWLVFELMWIAWTLMTDAGTQADEAAVVGRISAMLVSMIGILYFAVFLAITVDIVRDKLDRIKMGKGQIVERDHFLILGWNDRAFNIMRELELEATLSTCECMVILADITKETFQDNLSDHLLDIEDRMKSRMRIVFRSGDPTSVTALKRVCATSARAVIILADHSHADDADALTLRKVLSLKALRIDDEKECAIIAEMRDVDNEGLVAFAGGNNVKMINSHDLTGWLMLLSSRQPGISLVYDELVGSSANSFFLEEIPEAIVGLTFREASGYALHWVLIGIMTEDNVLLINPDHKRRLESSCRLVVISTLPGRRDPKHKLNLRKESSERRCIRKKWRPEQGKTLSPCPGPSIMEAQDEEHILICGWRRDIRDILLLLDSMVTTKGRVDILSEHNHQEREKLLLDGGLDIVQMKNLTISYFMGNSVVRRHLEDRPVENYSSIMVVADVSREHDVMASDSHTLATFLLLRDIQSQRLGPKCMECSIVCEFMDKRAQLLTTQHPQYNIITDEHIRNNHNFVSHEVIDRMLALIAGRPEVQVILDDLLSHSGAAIFVKERGRYVRNGEMMSFWAVAQRCYDLDEILIGRIKHGAAKPELNVQDKDVVTSWEQYDVVVIAGGLSRPTKNCRGSNMTRCPIAETIHENGSDGDFVDRRQSIGTYKNCDIVRNQRQIQKRSRAYSIVPTPPSNVVLNLKKLAPSPEAGPTASS